MSSSSSSSGGDKPVRHEYQSKLTAKNIMTTSVAGGVSGALEILFTYPFEYAKTQQQLYPDQFKGKQFWTCWTDTYKRFGGFPKGFTALYRGMPPLILFGVPRNASRFTGFELMHGILQNNTDMGVVPTRMMAGAFGGLCEAVLVTTYQETMKVRLIHDRLKEQPRFKNTFDGIRTILQEQGIRGVYKGLGATIVKQSSNQMIRFPIYFYLKSLCVENINDDFAVNGAVVGNLQAMAVGGLAGAASVLGNTPVDVIKTKMQGLEADRYKSTMHCISSTFREEGVAGFYRGMGARMGRVSADVALTFFFMEKVKSAIKAFFP